MGGSGNMQELEGNRKETKTQAKKKKKKKKAKSYPILLFFFKIYFMYMSTL